MTRVAGAALRVRAARLETVDLTDAQRELAASQAKIALFEALVDLDEYIPVLRLRAGSGESIDRMLAEIDAAPAVEDDPRALLLPVAVIAMRLGTTDGSTDGVEHLWQRLDERLGVLQHSKPRLYRRLEDEVHLWLARVRREA